MDYYSYMYTNSFEHFDIKSSILLLLFVLMTVIEIIDLCEIKYAGTILLI